MNFIFLFRIKMINLKKIKEQLKFILVVLSRNNLILYEFIKKKLKLQKIMQQ